MIPSRGMALLVLILVAVSAAGGYAAGRLVVVPAFAAAGGGAPDARPRWNDAALAYARKVESTPGWVTVLEYHEVLPQPTPGDVYVISSAVFDRQMTTLASSGRPVITVARMARDLLRQQVPRGAVVITFDDGYEGVFANAWPMLHSLGLPATCFVIGVDTYVPSVGAGHLTLAQLRQLQASGWDMESHSFNLHSPSPLDFGNAPAWYAAQDLALEDHLLRSIGNADPVAFAYPNAGATPANVAAAQRRYLLAFVEDPPGGAYRDSPYAWPRVLVSEASHMRAILAGDH